MIVTNVQSGCKIVLQSTHALLAGYLAEQLAFDEKPPFWFETKVAIAEHDDSKMECKAGRREYLTDAGLPRDFTLVESTADQILIETRRRLENAYRKHRWMGLLQSMHVETLYGKSQVDNEMRKLLKVEQEHRTQVLRDLKESDSTLRMTYDWMHWCDRTSLILCQSAIPSMHRRIEITTIRKNIRFDLWETEEQTVAIEPWPFLKPTFDVHFEYRVLEKIQFSDDLELDKALQSANVIVQTKTLRAAPQADVSN